MYSAGYCDQNVDISTNFPSFLNVVDVKSIRIIHPLNSINIYCKTYSSIVLMAVADAKYRFVYDYVEAYGKDGGSKVFKTVLYGEISWMDQPDDKYLSNTKNSKKVSSNPYWTKYNRGSPVIVHLELEGTWNVFLESLTTNKQLFIVPFTWVIIILRV